VTTSSESPVAIESSQERLAARRPRRWADSIWFDLAISFIVGLLYTLIMMGPGPLNPRNIGWLIGDPADHFIGWELFRQDPHWHWPLTFTDRVGYPVGESIALMDPNTLLVVLLKPLSPLLPEPFQFFGLESALGCVLQFFFSMRLFRLLLGANRLGAVLCSFFFLAATPLAMRMGEIYSLTNQWLLIAALLVYVQAQEESPGAVKRFVIYALILGAVAVAINPYLAFQTLLVLTAAAGSLVWQRRLPLRKAVAFMAVLGGIGVIVADTFGFIIAGGKGYTSFGYRFYALNLLTPFDPTLYGALLSRLLPHYPYIEVRTGNYLGAGVILLGVFLLILVVLQRRKPGAADLRRWGPLFLCCVVLTLMALSTRVMAGSVTVVDFDPRQHLTRFLAALRSSERLFWVPYYTIFTAVLAAPFLLFRRSYANLLVAIVLAVQLLDLSPLWERTHTRVNRTWPMPLKSPIWSQLGSVHENLVVLPAYQCGIPSTPATSDGYRIFGLLAVAQRMRTNSYYAGRYTDVTRAYHCKQSIAALAEQPLSPDNAYVVTPALAEVIAKGPSGPGTCHEVDGFILCSAKLDFGPDAKAVPESQSE
jgi:Family of unknown function (DUF6311)